MLGRYDRIEKVTYENDLQTNLLTGDGVPSELEVDLLSNCRFNTEFQIKNRDLLVKINHISDLLQFAKENHIKLHCEDISISGNTIKLVFVGEEKDVVITEDLSFNRKDRLFNTKTKGDTQMGKEMEKEMDELIATFTWQQKDYLYRTLWVEHVKEDVLSCLEDNADQEIIPECVKKEDFESIAETCARRYCFEGDYDCTLSYWDNIQNLVNEEYRSYENDNYEP